MGGKTMKFFIEKQKKIFEAKDLKRYRTVYQSNLRKKYKVHGPANKQHT